MTRRRPPGRRPRGAALVEFAMVLPVLLMLSLAVVDWGWFFVVQDATVNASREGARAGALGGDGGARATALLNGMLPAWQSGRCTVTPTIVPPDTYRVVASCPVGSISGVTHVPPFTLAQPPAATARVEMRR